jgi:hypothetical protein
MSKLLIFYDPADQIIVPRDVREHTDIKVAEVPLADGIEGRDIYEIARKLAGLLLEQL